MVVTGTRGAKATGTIIFGGGAKPDGIAGIRVTAPAADIDSNPMPIFGGSNVKDTGAFEVDRPGRRAHLPRRESAASGWILKSVTLQRRRRDRQGRRVQAGRGRHRDRDRADEQDDGDHRQRRPTTRASR